MNNGLKMSGNDSITIATTGSLCLFSGGDSLVIGGNGIFNQNGNAANLIVYGTPSVTSLTLNGNGTFTGVIVAPNANTKMNGGGYDVNDGKLGPNERPFQLPL
jgi:hypothetical protein